MREASLHQDVTYWDPGAEDRFGAVTFSAPELLKARWEDRNETVKTTGGDTIVTRAVVFVDRDLLIGGYLAKGDFSAVQDPTLIPDASEIQAWASIPDIRNVSSERRAYL